MKIKCPDCGSTDVAAEWDTRVIIGFKDGKVVNANVGGVLCSLPDRIFCSHCGDEKRECPAKLGNAMSRVIEKEMPAAIVENLTDPWDVWVKP